MNTAPTKQLHLKSSRLSSPGHRAVDPAIVAAATDSVSGLRRVLYLFFAGVFFLLAIAGVILPGLPTTPFLLLTSYFLVRSYPRLNEPLLKSKLFGPILVDWQVKGGVRRDIKVKAISVVLIAIGFSLYVSQFSLTPSLIVSVSAGVGIFVILQLPEPRD